jgi:predicted TIM-barrel fold metal-dependent hydrolase
MPRLCVGPGTPTAPSFEVPQGACDTHLHVLGPFDRFPLADARPYTPPEAPLEKAIVMLDTLGIERMVVAHVSAHGMDLKATLDALSRLGDRARGTALLEPGVSDSEIEKLHNAGMRGVRLSPAYGAQTSINEAALRYWAERIAPFDWHIAMWPSEVDEIALLRRLVDELPARLVIDHLGNAAWAPALGVSQPGFRQLIELLRTDRVWVKLSAMYRASDAGSPWRELIPYGAALVEANPGRMLWASDWPHVGLWTVEAMPHSGDLLDWLQAIGADAAMRKRILVDNPIELYGFAPVDIRPGT